MNSEKIMKKGFTKLVVFVLSVLCLGTLCLYIKAAPTELVDQNYLANLLTAAVPTGSGTNFAYDCRSLSKTMETYIEHIEQRPMAFLLRLLFPSYGPRRRLGPVALALKNVPDDEQAARNVLQNAAIQMDQFCRDLEKFPKSPIQWFKHEKLSDKLVTDISNALVKSHEMAGKLETEPNAKNALTAFRTEREAFCLLFLGRLGYPYKTYKEMIEGLLIDIEKTRDYTVSLAEKMEQRENKDLLHHWAEVEEFWVNVLKALSDNNMDKVRELTNAALSQEGNPG